MESIQNDTTKSKASKRLAHLRRRRQGNATQQSLRGGRAATVAKRS